MIERHDKRQFLTFLVCVAVSTSLWLLIKLAKDYSTQTSYTVYYSEVPVNKWISTPEQSVKLSFDADGFATLRHNLIREQRRVVVVPLDEVPYRLEGGVTYSYSSQYIAELVAEHLGIAASNITINDDKQYFNMEDLQSKILPVRIPLDIKLQRQYQIYGSPSITPNQVTVFGPQRLLDTLECVWTEPLISSNVSENVEGELEIDLLDGAIRCSDEKVHATVAVEPFTETDIEIPVTVRDSLSLRFFPETIKVKCMVAVKDYPSLNASLFRVEADTAQLHQLQPLLDVSITKIPPMVQVLSSEPSRVEYLILNR